MTAPLNTAEAAHYLRLPVRTLTLWREKRRGPRYYKVGKAIRYYVVDLDAWLRGQVVEPKGV